MRSTSFRVATLSGALLWTFAALGATTEIELPGGAQLIGVTAQRGRGKPETNRSASACTAGRMCGAPSRRTLQRRSHNSARDPDGYATL